MNPGELVPFLELRLGDVLYDPERRVSLVVENGGLGSHGWVGWYWVQLRTEDGRKVVRWFPDSFHLRRIAQAKQVAA